MLAIVLIAFTAIGALRGLIREIMTLITWAASILVAWLFAGAIEHWFDWLFHERSLRLLVAFVALFALTWVAGMLAAMLMNRYFSKGLTRWPNLIGGGLIGMARGTVVVVIVFLAAGVTSAPQQGWWRDSSLAPHFEKLALHARPYLPRDVARHIRYS